MAKTLPKLAPAPTPAQQTARLAMTALPTRA